MFMVNNIRCLHGARPKKQSQFLQFSIQTKFEIFGYIIKECLIVKCAIKGGSHLNLPLCYEIGINNNDAILFWSTFVTCSCMS
jgi:hypothetical protein